LAGVASRATNQAALPRGVSKIRSGLLRRFRLALRRRSPGRCCVAGTGRGTAGSSLTCRGLLFLFLLHLLLNLPDFLR